MRRCASCGEENAERARFCQACGTALDQPEPIAEFRKVVTVVFADVTGSTALGERLDPEALRRVMGRYFDEMAAVINRHGGTVEKFIGDAVMAVFGIPRLHEDDPVRAVRAAAGMRQALAELNAELKRDHGVGLEVRIGVNTGEVVAGDTTTGQRIVTGDAVNVAARLEQAATPGEILLGETTRRLVKDAVEVESVEPLDLKGKSDPVHAFRLVSVRPDVAGHVRRLDSPLVGRQKELDLFSQALDRAVTERTSHLFTLLGSAGVGKSRLVHEFLEGQGTGVAVVRGRCLSYGEGITFFPLSEVVQEAAGIDEADDRAGAREKVLSLLADAEGADRIGPLVSGLLGWDEPSDTEDAFWAVRKLLEHVAGDRPLIIVFDDVHWAEPTFLDLVEHVADWTRDAAVLIVCLARPELLELRPGWGGGKLNATSILLEPLAGDSASALVDNLLGRAEIPDPARVRILETAEGNPLFVEETLRMLIDDGLLRLDEGIWHGVDDLADVTVPPTIQLLLAARLDRLDAEERAVMERGAVEGNVFHAGAVTTLTPDSLRTHVRSRLLTLARKELIRPDRAEFAGEDAFRFRHLLIRDAAYHAMPKEQRADLHERFAGWLEQAAGERVAEYEEILAHHLEQAYRFRLELGPPDERMRALATAAARRLVASADRAQHRGDLTAARLLLERCVEISEGATRANALTEHALTLGELNDFQASARVAEEAITAAEASDDRACALRAEIVLIEARGQIDPGHTLARSREAIQRVLTELEALGDDKGVIRASLAASRIAFYEGRCDRSIATFEPLLDRVEQLSTRDRREIAQGLAAASYFGGAPVEEVARIGELAGKVAGGGIVAEAWLSVHDLLVLSMEGHAEEAWRQVERAERLWAELGNPKLAVSRYMGFGEAMLLLGRPDLAERYLRLGAEELDELGETGFNSTTTAVRALALCDLERFDEAEDVITRSRELSAEDDFASQSGWRLAQARVLSQRGEHDAAVALADQAVAILDTTDYLLMQAGGHEIRGLVLGAAGRTEEARTAFGDALERYERKGSVPASERVRALMP